MRTRTDSAAPEVRTDTLAPVANDTSMDVLISTDTSLTPEQQGERAAAAARERRFNELLRAAPPGSSSTPAAAAVAPSAAKPSLLDRVVAPIANALGINTPRPQRATPSPQAQPQQRPSESRPSSSSSQQTEPERRDPDDPDTDTIPPQLMAAEFTPAQVADGQETVFGAVVNDNLSGVRSVSGVIASPSGSMQGFACTREGETNRFVARINVPDNAPAGVWVVKYLTLMDNASNSINLNAMQGGLPSTASFRVVSNDADATGPQLKRLWLDRQAMRTTDHNTLFVEAEDDKSGIALVSGVLVSPSQSARIGFGCRAGSTGVWECPITPPVCLDCGRWQLEQIQLQDKANNSTALRRDNSEQVRNLALDIAGDRCDAQAPVITSVTVDPLVISNAERSVITVTATAVDEGGCGVASLSVQAVPVGGIGGQRQAATLMPTGDGTTCIGKITMPANVAKGMWSLSWLHALDKGNNLRAYSATDPVLSRVTFRVE